MQKLSLALTLFASLAMPAAAHADTYTFTIESGTSSHGSPAATFVASGTLTGDRSMSVPSALDLTSVTGSAHVYEGASGYQVDVFDPNDPADLTPFSIGSFTLNPSSVPEPSTLALLGTGALGMLGAVRRRLGA